MSDHFSLWHRVKCIPVHLWALWHSTYSQGLQHLNRECFSACIGSLPELRLKRNHVTCCFHVSSLPRPATALASFEPLCMRGQADPVLQEEMILWPISFTQSGSFWEQTGTRKAWGTQLLQEQVTLPPISALSHTYRQSWRGEATKRVDCSHQNRKYWSEASTWKPLKENKHKHRQQLQLIAYGGDIDRHQVDSTQFKKCSSTYSFPWILWGLQGPDTSLGTHSTYPQSCSSPTEVLV